MLSEKTVLNQVTILPEQSTINVRWSDQVLRNGKVISEVFRRKAYSQAQMAEFEAEVEDAAMYASAVGWV